MTQTHISTYILVCVHAYIFVYLTCVYIDNIYSLKNRCFVAWVWPGKIPRGGYLAL
jgi:hypothetical protein